MSRLAHEWGASIRFGRFYLGEAEVSIDDYTFSPNSVNLAKGGELTWVNEDTFAYSIVAGTQQDPAGSFYIYPLYPGETFTVRFDTVGTFPFFSHANPETMTGVVNVSADTTIQVPVTY